MKQIGNSEMSPIFLYRKTGRRAWYANISHSLEQHDNSMSNKSRRSAYPIHFLRICKEE